MLADAFPPRPWPIRESAVRGEASWAWMALGGWCFAAAMMGGWAWTLARTNPKSHPMGAVALAVAALAWGVRDFRRRRAGQRPFRRALEEGEVRAAKLIDDWQRRTEYTVIYELDGKLRTVQIGYEPPLYVGPPEKKRIAVLVAPEAPDQPVVLDQSLRHFDFSEEIRKRIVADCAALDDP